MKRHKIIVLLFILLSISAVPSYASNEDNIGKITFQLNLPPSITDDLYLDLLNMDTEETITLDLLNSTNYRAERELSYGNYKIVNIEMNNLDKYDILLGGAFEITKDGFDLKMSIKEKPIKIDTGWVNIKAIVPSNYQGSISFVLQTEDISQTHVLLQNTAYSAKVELPYGEYSIRDITLQTTGDIEYTIKHIEKFIISQIEAESIFIIKEIQQEDTNPQKDIEITEEIIMENDTDDNNSNIDQSMSRFLLLMILFIIAMSVLFILYRKIVGQ